MNDLDLQWWIYSLINYAGLAYSCYRLGLPTKREIARGRYGW